MAEPLVKHGDYIVQIGPNASIYPQIRHPQAVTLGNRDHDGANFSFGMSLLTEPFLMVEHEHTHEFDQILYFLGQADNVGDFQAQVKLRVGNDHQDYLIDYPSCVYIPAGVMHCPLEVLRVDKPFIFIDITLSPGASIHPVPDQQK